ncbi:phospholipid-transporting P-type ATPase [Tupanvirus deep ocean]|uniref:Phospholipid-transporting P-type ATPase n=2 Tax=Tupanvirus TaxID=2094720 RepID=A0AC62A7R7_9VIRU|nr:phospholipid-transporting P-type ATPase [Tupanvirus deep ocean]QKU33678.1 phospholipid-transporting P-type ATPase [Tupanvirus deep ocean]
MDLEFGKINLQKSNNKINRLQYGIYLVPILTTYKYFKNYENIYFLVLSIFQLLTLGIFPREWSPTGPFSTAIPLMFCVAIEIFTAMYKWISIWIKDNIENKKIFKYVDESKLFIDIKNQDIYPGYILYLVKDEIVPVDGILISTLSDDYGKINLALLTGESNMHYISKPIRNFTLNDCIGSELHLEEVTSRENVSGYIKTIKQKICITKNNFIPAGAIIKSDGVYIWVTACGKDKLNKMAKQSNKPNSRIDRFVGDYMMKTSVFLLVVLVFLISVIKTFASTNPSVIVFILYCLQNWILFNGIIPFSVKIFLLIARNIEANYCKANTVTVNDSSQIDDFGKIKKIICDKTGTVTKNELEFTKFVDAKHNNIIDLALFSSESQYLPDKVYECLGLCIHQDDEDFSTIEDKIIRTGFLSLGAQCIENDKHIVLNYNEKEKKYQYIQSNDLDFTFDRKMSSKIVVTNDGEYFIYTKGSLDAIYNKLSIQCKDNLKKAEHIISHKYPELRLLALAYKQLSKEEILYLEELREHSFLEYNLNFLGIVGIKDIIQLKVETTVEVLDNYGINCSLCTGDRKITAIAVAQEVNIAKKEDIVEYNEFVQASNIVNKTLIFSGEQVKNIDFNDNLKNCICSCKNFIGYHMSPIDKRKVVNVLEQFDVRTLSIGDGFNDFGMFDMTSISVAIKGNNFVENYADYSVKQFSDLQNLFDLSIESYHKNANLINFTFLRCSTVIFAIVVHCLMNYHKTYESPFNGFVIQAFNFAWTFFGLIYLVLQNNNQYVHHKNKNFQSSRLLLNTCYKCTSVWNIMGIMNGVVIVLLCYYYKIYLGEYFNDVLALFVIISLNIKLLFMAKIELNALISVFLGIINFLVYLLFTQKLFGVLHTIFNLPNNFYYIMFLQLITVMMV